MSKKLLTIILLCSLVLCAGMAYKYLTAQQKLVAIEHEMSAQRNTLEAAMDGYQSCLLEKNNPNAQPGNTPDNEPTSDLEKIFDPELSEPSQRAKMDALKKRYEEVLVSYFVLRKCGKINPIDYHVITSALAQEMASVNAPGRLQYDILIAAKGSYDGLYAKSSCKEDSIATLYDGYKRFIDSVTEQFNLR